MIKEANVTLMVADMKRSLEFYTETLGLILKASYGEEFAQVEAPGTVIALHPVHTDNQSKESSGLMSIGFWVDDLDRMVTELRAKGIVFSKLTDDGQVRLAFFADPDGFSLYLSQNKWG